MHSYHIRDLSKLSTSHMQYKAVRKSVINVNFYLHENSSHLYYSHIYALYSFKFGIDLQNQLNIFYTF